MSCLFLIGAKNVAACPSIIAKGASVLSHSEKNSASSSPYRNKSGAGLAYYSGDHSAFNGDNLGSYLYKDWTSLHEFGHGYEGAIANQENSFVGTTNNIMGYYFEPTYPLVVAALYCNPVTILGNLDRILRFSFTCSGNYC